VDESVEWQDEEEYIVSPDERKWQSVITFPASTSNNILNVLQMGPASMTGFDTLEHLENSENSGVRIGTWVLLFAKEEGLRGSATYSVSNTTANMQHLVADLTPGNYSIMVNNQKIGVVTVEDQDNTALFQTNDALSILEVSLQPDN